MKTSRPSTPARTTPRRLRAEDHLGLVRKVAWQIHRALDRRTEFDELLSYGVEGLLLAIERFDPDFGVSFSTFALHRIRGAIWDGVRNQCPLSGRQYRRLRTAERAAQALAEKERGERAPGEELDARLTRVARVFVQSLDELPPSLLRSHEPTAEAHCEARRMTLLLGAAMERLPERQRALLERHYWQDMTLLDAGAELGVTKSWACRMHARAVVRLREEMRAVLDEAA